MTTRSQQPSPEGSPGRPATADRAPVSIICVYNDPEVRKRCLDRSIDEHRPQAPQVEYLPIDNVGRTFATAAAALNHGAALATHDCLVFVHQDVYLQSLTALEEAAAMLARRPDLGLLGAIGITPEGRYAGRIRDRIVLLGDPAPDPVEVDSLDEVLFMIPRRLWEREPLADVPELAWHAYAVEYGLRMATLGLRTAATDLPLTHNSLTVNLDRLDVAHHAVAQRHPYRLPVRTTCGTITAPARSGGRRRPLTAQRWRYRWLRESVVAHAVRRAVGGPVVLSDVRRDIDAVMALVPDSRLRVVNLETGTGWTGTAGEPEPPLRLLRRAVEVTLSCGDQDRLVEAVLDRRPGETVLLTNLSVERLRRLAPVLARGAAAGTPRLAGFHAGIGCWLLLGPGAAALPPCLRTAGATPFGMRRLAG